MASPLTRTWSCTQRRSPTWRSSRTPLSGNASSKRPLRVHQIIANAIASAGIAQDQSPGSHEDWSCGKWLTGLGVAEEIARVLLLGVACSDGQAGLSFFQELGKASRREEGEAALLDLFRQGNLMDALAALVWPHVEALGSSAGTSSLQTKFVQDGAGIPMSFLGNRAFFEGLESRIGPPNPSVYQGMEDEHMERPDSENAFTSDNYGITTESSTEWWFAAIPQKR